MKHYYKDVAPELMKRGFKVVPIKHGMKHPARKDWQNLKQDNLTYKRMCVEYGDKAGVGIITTNNVMAIDIDVTHPNAAREIIQYVREMLSYNNIMVRRGKRPKALIPCYVKHDIGKVVSSVWHSEKHGNMMIELLSNNPIDYADGSGARQFVAYGDYLDTDKQYEWENDFSLLDIASPGQLPTFEPEMIQSLFKFFDDVMYRNGCVRVQNKTDLKTAHLGDINIEDEDEILLQDAKIAGISDERVAEIVNALGKGFYDDYDKWIKIGQAIKFQISDDDKAFKLWKSWSRKAVNPETNKPYDVSDREFRSKWQSFRNDRLNGVTFASVLYDYYSVTANENFTEAFDKLKTLFNECETAEQYDAYALEASYNRFNAAQQNAVEQVMMAAYKRVYGVKTTVANVRKTLAENVEHSDMPDYMKRWVYVLNGDKFYDFESKLEVTPMSFDTLIYGEVPDAMSMTVRPQDLAVKAYKIPKVIDKMYMPSMGNLFKLSERDKYYYVNAYRDDTPATEPDRYTDGDLRAIELVEHHFTHLIADERERSIFKQWVAYQVQHTGIPLGWAVMIHGVGGEGKTFFHEMITAMIGGDNAKYISQNAIKSPFNKWASNLSLGTIEEVALKGTKGIEVYDSLKTIISNKTIAMTAKGKDEINVMNTANYLFLTNRLGALPIDASDRRIFAIYSRWQDGKKLEEFKKNNPKYYSDLHNTYKNHAGALRKHFRTEVELTDEFLSFYDAPRTQSRERLIGENMPEIVRDLLEIVATKSDPYLSEQFLDVKYFRKMRQFDKNYADNYIRWQQYLIPLGYEQVSNAVRIPEIDKGYLHTIFSKKPEMFRRDTVAETNKMLRKYAQHSEDLVFVEDDDLPTEEELDDL